MNMRNFLLLLCLFAALGPLSPETAQGAAGAETPSEEGAQKLYLPASPRAAAYMLGRLSNKELLKAPRVEPVFKAFLERTGLDPKYREEALAGLATLHKSDRLSELLSALERLDAQGTNAFAAISDLAALLAKSKSADLAAKKPGLEALIAKAEQPLTRRAAFAGLVTAEGKSNPIWDQVAQEDARLADLVGAVPLIVDTSLRASFQPMIAPLAQKAVTPELQQLAILALPAMKGYEGVNFAALSGLIRAGTERIVAVRALLQLPRSVWQKEQAGPVAQSLVDYATEVPADQRTEADFLDAVQLGNDLSLLMLADDGRRIRKALAELGVRVLVLKTLPEQMFYDKTRLVVEAGKPVEIIFENPDSMPHNFVITVPGAREEIGKLAETMVPQADEEGRMFIPKSPKVLFASKLVDPGAKLKLNFTAPTEPGEYSYVCTFPGHWLRMFGTLVVAVDVEDYLARNPEPDAPKLTEWKMADFADDLKQLDHHRSYASGKALFSSLGCVQCHQLGTEGAVFGPSLTGVFARWKDDRGQVLEQILEPSKVVDEKFRARSFELGDENTAVGIVLAEDAESVTLQTGPSAALIQKIKKVSIKSRATQEGSLMPAGLLNLINKPQILDLLAFLLAEGNADHRAFKHD